MPFDSRPHSRPLHRPLRFDPSPAEVDALIDHAESHPLGTEFLRQGALDAVAATFSTHAFTVLSARERLGPPLPRRGRG